MKVKSVRGQVEYTALVVAGGRGILVLSKKDGRKLGIHVVGLLAGFPDKQAAIVDDREWVEENTADMREEVRVSTSKLKEIDEIVGRLVCVLLQLLVAARVYNCLLSPLSSFLPICQLQLQRISFSRFSSWCSFCWCRLAEQHVLRSSLLPSYCLVLLACHLLLLLVLHFLFPPLVPCFFLSHFRFLLQVLLALFLLALLPPSSCFLCSPLSNFLFLLLLSSKINLSQPQYSLNCSVYLVLLVVLDL